MFVRFKYRAEFVAAISILLIGTITGYVSLWLSIVPSVINHQFPGVEFVGASYNRRLPWAEFLGVAIQGVILSSLLAMVTRRLRFSSMLCAAFFLFFAVLLPSPATMYPHLPEYGWWLRCAYGVAIGLVATYLFYRGCAKRVVL